MFEEYLHCIGDGASEFHRMFHKPRVLPVPEAIAHLAITTPVATPVPGNMRVLQCVSHNSAGEGLSQGEKQIPLPPALPELDILPDLQNARQGPLAPLIADSCAQRVSTRRQLATGSSTPGSLPLFHRPPGAHHKRLPGNAGRAVHGCANTRPRWKPQENKEPLCISRIHDQNI